MPYNTMYPSSQYYDSNQTRTADMAPGLTRSAMSTQSDVMDLDSTPLEAHIPRIQNYHFHVEQNQLEIQRRNQQQFQQQQQQQQQQEQQRLQQQQHHQHHQHQQQHHYQQQQQHHYQQQHQHHHQQQHQQQHQHNQHQQQYPPQQPYQSQHQQQPPNHYPSDSHQSVHYPPQQQPQAQGYQQLYNNPTNQTWQSSECHLMTPSSVETEMPSLAFSDGNSTISQGMQHNQALNKAPPSPSLSPRGPDSAESTDSDYFLTSVLSMIAPARIPQVSILDYSEFIERQLITKGGNGEIRRAFWPRAQTVVILKSLIDTKHSPARLAKLFDKEVEVMNQCRYHDNIVQFYGVAIRTCDDERNGERFMVMQYYEKGDLVKLIEASPNTEEYPTFTDKMYLAMDIAIGLDHLFKCGFHHGDLHPKNILIDTRRDRKTEQGRYQAKLTDFGLRRIRDSKNLFSSQQFGGVLQFIAPERMTKNRPRYDVRCDIFALGVIYWFIIAGRYPFKDPSTFSPGAREGRIDGTPNWYYNVYTQAWDEDPNMRQQTLDEIVQVFRYNLGIQTPPIQYLDPNTAHGQYPTPSYGHEGSTFPSYTSFDSQPHHYTGSSAGGSTIRGSPMLTPASMLTPVSLNGGMSPLPSSPLFANSTASTSTGTRSTNPNHPRNRKPNVPGGMPIIPQHQ